MAAPDTDPGSICDRCANAIVEDEDALPGPAGTEWEGCTLCPVCADEVAP